MVSVCLAHACVSPLDASRMSEVMIVVGWEGGEINHPPDVMSIHSLSLSQNGMIATLTQDKNRKHDNQFSIK